MGGSAGELQKGWYCCRHIPSPSSDICDCHHTMSLLAIQIHFSGWLSIPAVLLIMVIICNLNPTVHQQS